MYFIIPVFLQQITFDKVLRSLKWTLQDRIYIYIYMTGTIEPVTDPWGTSLKNGDG